jgi:hypothetical protein
MANDTLLGQTESTDQYDGSGVFNTSALTQAADPSFVPTETDSDSSDDNSSESSTRAMLMYAGAALLLYFFFFKKK